MVVIKASGELRLLLHCSMFSPKAKKMIITIIIIIIIKPYSLNKELMIETSALLSLHGRNFTLTNLFDMKF